jgi:AcrR family transcriptional regulator
MPRLSRLQSQEKTREKLIASARSAFAARGFGATTVEHIAESAGFSKGAFYSNFVSKEALAHELTYQAVNDRLVAWVKFVSGSVSNGPEAVVAALRAGADAVESDLDRDRLHLELVLRGSRDPAVGKALRDQFLENRSRITDMFGAVFAVLGRQPPIAAEQLANLILLIHYGRKVMEICDIPHDPGEITEVVFQALLATSPRLAVAAV